MKIDWKRKLSSRKFWVALIGFISALCIAFNVDSGTVEQVTAIIMSGTSLIAYILAEGWVDSKNITESEAKKDTYANGFDAGEVEE